MESVVQQPLPTIEGGSFIISFANAYDQFHKWGTSIYSRDQQLRDFWITEPMLCSAMFSTVSKYTAFGWNLEGPARAAKQVRTMFHDSEHGKGWNSLNMKFLIDTFSQDNGGFLEMVRKEDDPASPVIQLNHLDSGSCFRTGRWDYPVVYRDSFFRLHKLAWYQVIPFEEFPSPIEIRHDLQYCTVTRMLNAAKILRNIEIYKDEKVSGRYTRAIHLVSGVQTQAVKDAIQGQQMEAYTQQYLQPIIIGSINPTANVSATTIDMASLPDGFDEETTMRWYINQLALAFGADYQDFAPLPGGNLGSAHQAQVLHLKSRGKGPALYMSSLEHIFNFHGVVPRTVNFAFGEQDVALDAEMEELRKLRAETLKILVDGLIYTPQVARQILMDSGDLDEKYLGMFGEQNATPDIRVNSSQKAIDIHKDSSGAVVGFTQGFVRKRIIRDANGRIEAVVEEPVVY